jgi:predicted HTH transcriptional regulator
MKMNEKIIKELLLKGERVTLECKRAKAESPKSVWATYSAFANTVGGLILLGVNEDMEVKDIMKRYQIIGVDDQMKIITDFWNTLNSDKVNENILLDSDVKVVDVDGVQIVCIHVPQADWRVKPIYLNGNVYKGTYRRNNEGDYHCTEAQVKAMIRDSNADGNDNILIEYYGMDDIDPASLNQYRTEFRQENRAHIWNSVDDKTFLKNLGGYTEDRQTGREGLTLAGLMMFGRGLAIRDRFSNFRMDYLDMSHLVGDERYHDRLTYDGLWENNLYQFFRLVLQKVQFDLPRPFKLDKGGRRNDDTKQHEAVREAFTNAIIHCDLMMDAGILRIEKHDDRLCFRNPGLLKLPVEAIYKGGNSKARNPKIQNMLRMIGFGENVGSGFPKIIAAWKETNWGEPQLLNKLDVDEVELVLPVPSPKATSDTAPANAPANAPVNAPANAPVNAPVKLIKTQIAIVKAIINDNHVTYEDLKTIIGVNKSTITRNIAVLKEKGVIRRVGEDKNGYWEVLMDNKNVE